jgi:hypothetical protein
MEGGGFTPDPIEKLAAEALAMPGFERGERSCHVALALLRLARLQRRMDERRDLSQTLAEVGVAVSTLAPAGLLRGERDLGADGGIGLALSPGDIGQLLEQMVAPIGARPLERQRRQLSPALVAIVALGPRQPRPRRAVGRETSRA